MITREMLGGKSTLSTQHARVRRDGPDYRIEDCSRNGIFRQAGHDWIRLPVSDQIEQQPIIQAGGHLRFADVPVDVVNV